jgi:hypothetical protein
VQFGDAIYALRTIEVNHTEMRVSPRIARTSDFRHWQVLAETSELPYYHSPATAGGTDLGSPVLDCKYLLRRISM